MARNDTSASDIDTLCPDVFAAPGTDAFQIHGSPPRIKKPPWLENQRGPVIGAYPSNEDKGILTKADRKAIYRLWSGGMNGR